jgi:hypothetical protein
MQGDENKPAREGLICFPNNLTGELRDGEYFFYLKSLVTH